MLSGSDCYATSIQADASDHIYSEIQWLCNNYIARRQRKYKVTMKIVHSDNAKDFKLKKKFKLDGS